ncbi:hypothetical protein GIB67_018156 [Kingdonia uniflora]|uniref:DUF4283 domain-containing protein n=1 Tax=Kingdonia uniflora TaxID=39325 RepID=A0A7J7NMF0_9MAGN|nr:hypothetical protein GIB67_018156 [Kingdonia uniflora]
MVWVRFPGLDMEYWEEESLLAISTTVGNPVHVDPATLKGNTGFYASVMVEVDFAKPIPNKVLIKGDESDF